MNECWRKVPFPESTTVRFREMLTMGLERELATGGDVLKKMKQRFRGI